jgi:pimeloyl-ACP methyl ester carboxylesterase
VTVRIARFGPLTAEVRGAGAPTVVLLHGNGEDARVFDRVLPHLADAQVVALETRGHGRTPMGDAPMTIPHLARDVDRALAAAEGAGVGEGRAVIVGFSDGANVGLELAIHRPERVAGLVLIGGNDRPTGLRPAPFGAVHAAWAGARLAGLVWPAARRRARILGLMVGQPRIAEADLATLAIPTLVVAGGRDVIARRHTERLAALIPGAELAIVPREGHMLPLRAPDVIGRLIAEFRAERVGAGSLGGGARQAPTEPNHPEVNHD